jgi:hypothetical protein
MTSLDPDRTRQAVRQHAQRQSLLAALAIVGQLIFAASALLLPIWSEYGLIGTGTVLLAAALFSMASALGVSCWPCDVGRTPVRPPRQTA